MRFGGAYDPRIKMVRSMLLFKTTALRILATLEAETAKICNFWTFCTVILLITGQNIQKLLIFYVLASSVASILKVKLHDGLCGSKYFALYIFFRV